MSTSEEESGTADVELDLSLFVLSCALAVQSLDAPAESRDQSVVTDVFRTYLVLFYRDCFEVQRKFTQPNSLAPALADLLDCSTNSLKDDVCTGIGTDIALLFIFKECLLLCAHVLSYFLQ